MAFSVLSFPFLLLSLSTLGNGGLFDPCSDTATCSTILFSYCRKNPLNDCNGMGTCACIPDYLPYLREDEEETCLPKAVRVGQTCQQDVQCTALLGGSEATYCDKQTDTCECLEGYTSNTTTCLARKNLGEECIENIQCSSHVEYSVCEEIYEVVLNRCECAESYYQPDSGTNMNVCLKGAGNPGDSCEGHPVQCRGLGNGTCNPSSKTCECAENHVWIESVGKCMKKVKHLSGERCETSEQCQVKHSSCIDNVCSCDGELYAANPDSEECMEAAAELGSPCQHSAQCQANLCEVADCVNETCVCITGTILGSFEGGERCFVPVPLGGACNYTDECMDKSGARNLIICEENECVCAGYNISAGLGGVCYHARTIGDEVNCGSTLECKASIKDGKSQCTCDIGYAANANGSRCILGNLQYGEYCETDGQCRNDLECDTYVFSPVCRCPRIHGNTGRFDYESDQCEKSGAINIKFVSVNLFFVLSILYYVQNLIK